MIAAYPGSFDPFTKGHLDILCRASTLFETVYVMVSNNQNKTHYFTPTERKTIIEKPLTDVIGGDNIKVVTHTGVTADFLSALEVDVVVRGVRNATDLNYEIKLEQYLRATTPAETIYLTPMTENLNTSATLVRMFLITGRLAQVEPFVTESAFAYLSEFKQF